MEIGDSVYWLHAVSYQDKDGGTGQIMGGGNHVAL